MSLNYLGYFEDWEIAISKKLISNFRQKWDCLKRVDFDDLLQECLAHWCAARERYDPRRVASQRTFMAQVVRNKLWDLVRENEAHKRDIACHTISLDEPTVEDDESSTLASHVGDENAQKPFVRAELRVDLTRALEKLTPEQQELCTLLASGYTVAAASQRLKISRNTIYDEIKRMKVIFLKERLKNYLE